jgi:transketolase
MTIEELKKKANQIRDEVIRVAVKNNAGHIAPSLSTVDILVALYYEIMSPFKHRVAQSYFLNEKHFHDRDHLILSKGHGCYALYAILADLGILPKDQWENFNTTESELKGCVEYRPEWGLEASTGSLGHGLPIAVGMAYAAKLQKKNYKVYCIVGDGEMQEGSNREALQFIVENNLLNLHIIIDDNKLRALDETQIISLSIVQMVCKGHSIEELIDRIPRYNIIRANTIKGYGLKCMEGVSKFHYRVPTKEELAMGRTYDSKL